MSAKFEIRSPRLKLGQLISKLCHKLCRYLESIAPLRMDLCMIKQIVHALPKYQFSKILSENLNKAPNKCMYFLRFYIK